MNRAREAKASWEGALASVCLAFERSHLSVFALDAELRVCAANPAAEALFPQSWRGTPLTVSACAELYGAAHRAQLSGQACTATLLQFPLSALSGFWTAECVPCVDLGAGVLVLLRDDGELQALRRELERANRSESLGRLAGSIAHDFNNLLTGIRGSLALARENLSRASRESALRGADLAAQRAAEMTRQLLNFSRGPAYVPPRPDAEAVLLEAAELMRCMPDGASIELDLAPNLGKADVSAAELHQILLNLLMNARDAVKQVRNGGRITVRAARYRGAEAEGDAVLRDPVLQETLLRSSMTVPRGSAERLPNGAAPQGVVSHRVDALPNRTNALSRQGDAAPARWLHIAVADTGPGMEAATRRRIFEPFFTTKQGQQGTGLGLSSVRDIVERAGGWIDVQSELQQGTTFNVYVPLLAEGPAMNLENAQSRTAQKTEQVLICDDESRLASLTAGLLTEFGYSSTAVGAGEEALDVMRTRQGSVDVLLLDVNLSSGVTAQDVLETMSREGLDSRVILTSGFAQEDVPLSLRQHDHVASYLPKPYTVNELVSAINRAVESRQHVQR